MAKQLLPSDKLLLLHLRLSDLSTRIWIDAAPHHLVAILLNTSFIDCFILGSLPVDRNVIYWKLQLVAILAHSCTPQDKRTSSPVLHNLEQTINQHIYHNGASDFVGVAQNVVVQQNTLHHVLETAKSHGIFAIKTRVMLKNRYCSLIARRTTDISPGQLFSILVNSFFWWTNPRNRRYYHCALQNPSRFITCCRLHQSKSSSLENHNLDIVSSNSFSELHSNVLPVHYKRTKDQKSQMPRHTVAVENDDTALLVQDWQKYGLSLYEGSGYRDVFIFKLT